MGFFKRCDRLVRNGFKTSIFTEGREKSIVYYDAIKKILPDSDSLAIVSYIRNESLHNFPPFFIFSHIWSRLHVFKLDLYGIGERREGMVWLWG